MGAAVLSGFHFLSLRSAEATSPSETVQLALKDFQNSSDLSEVNYQFREFAENFPALKLERAPSRLKPSKLKISPDAISLIIAFEVSSETLYKQRYQKPVWPGGRSGITIGLGYDIGYVTVAGLKDDWSNILNNDSAIKTLSHTCGVTGDAARDLVPNVSDVEVLWEPARTQFDIEIQKYVALTQRSLPNFKALSEDCRGALVSLTYNRGPSFDVPETSDGSGRYREMRNIRKHMVQGEFKLIPDEIRSMMRLWPGVKGLLRRREAEAALFEVGLGKLPAN
ncbi:MAG: hypothetical protein E5X34_07285 [Mesorhizobium sp.]|uniref:hypothetical protein n=1 Tax=Mesorhizobium sp. TaxID=1871066 RepID=UPI0011F45ABE|nr:hypothetical protein [Mesorhizobium sp.]TIR25962.1 MAG: hypothetical protein E5X34_07285 [Mesorhizobium sp.]